MIQFKNGDPVIWDSGFGYELGFYIEEGDFMFNSYIIDIKTGNRKGNTMISKDDIRKWSQSLVEELSATYCCDMKTMTK